MDYATRMKLRRTGGSLCSSEGCDGIHHDGPGGGDARSGTCEECFQTIVLVERRERAEIRRAIAQARWKHIVEHLPISDLGSLKSVLYRGVHEGAWTKEEALAIQETPVTQEITDPIRHRLATWLATRASQHHGPRKALASEALQRAFEGRPVTIWVRDSEAQKVYLGIFGADATWGDAPIQFTDWPSYVQVKVGKGHAGRLDMVDPFFAHNGGER